MKYISLANKYVYENALYLINGVSRFAYHKSKASTRGGFVRRSLGSVEIRHSRPLTIHAQASLRTIINENVNKVPYRIKLIGQSQVYNLKVLPSTMSSNHMCKLASCLPSFSNFILSPWLDFVCFWCHQVADMICSPHYVFE